MKKSFILLLFITGISYGQNFAKDKLSLANCIQIALENNINLKRSELQARTEKITFRATKSQILPSINGIYNYALNKGRSIDPYTNDVIDKQFSYSNVGLRLDARIFNGFELKNKIQRDRFKMKAAEAEKEAAKQLLILDVTLAYFQILNDKDLLDIATIRMKGTEQQKEYIEGLNSEGEGNPADYSDIKGELISDQLKVVAAKTQLELSKSALRQLLNIDSEIQVEELLILPEMEKYKFSPKEIFLESLENFDVFEGQRLKISAAEKDVAVSRSLFIPEISLFAQLNSNYSSLANFLNETGTEIVETGEFINVNGKNYAVQANRTQFSQQKIPYFDQLNNNLNSVAGVTVDIPMFNRFTAKRQVLLKKIKLEDERLHMKNIKNEYQQAIKEAFENMEAAYKDYFFIKDQVTFYEESYRINEIRFIKGLSNFVEYVISKNRLDTSRINLTNAKYEYLIWLRILDYYRGNFD